MIIEFTCVLSICLTEAALYCTEIVFKPVNHTGYCICKLSCRYKFSNFIRNVLYVFPTKVGTLIVATIYLQLIQNRYMFRSFSFLQCSHQHCVQPVASDVEVVGYL